MVLSVLTRTYRQIASPPELLSPVMATVRFVSRGAIPVGGLLAGVVAGWSDSRAALVVFAVATVLVPLVLSPVRHVHDLTDAADGAPAPASRTGTGLSSPRGNVVHGAREPSHAPVTEEESGWCSSRTPVAMARTCRTPTTAPT